MPELPEVETIKKDLNKFVLHKTLKQVQIFLPRLIKSNLSQFKKTLHHNSFKKIHRVGKLLIFELNNKPTRFLLIHLKMTGQLIYCSQNILIAGGHSEPTITNETCKKNKYSYVIFNFTDASKLFFNDMRTFGTLKIVDSLELNNIISKYGIEPLQKNFTLHKLTQIINNHRISIKALLLNQNLIAGIGNIYADEILFNSKVMPTKPANNLKNAEIKKIFQSSLFIIKQAIKARGTTFNNYLDAHGKKGSYIQQLKVYGRNGQKCLNCNNKLLKIKIAGRSTVYCPHCQQ